MGREEKVICREMVLTYPPPCIKSLKSSLKHIQIIFCKRGRYEPIFLSWITRQFFDIKQLQVWFPMYDHYYTSVNYSMRGISISHPFPHSFTDSVTLRMARHRDLKEMLHIFLVHRRTCFQHFNTANMYCDVPAAVYIV